MPDAWKSFARRTAPPVLSFNVQAAATGHARQRSQFELLVRHLVFRMLHNDALGEEAAARIAQLTYAIALPGLLVALFLFPAYHGLPPHPQERSYWSQAADHLFYVTYAMVILSLAMILLWSSLFPDLLDIFILSSLPISRRRLLLGRIAALAVLLGFVQVGTSTLGILFFPAVADLRCGFGRHLLAHAAAVSLAGLFAAASLITLQSLLVAVLPGRILNPVAALTKALVATVVVTVLFLFPLTAHFLQPLLSFSTVSRYSPPFWFLGIYEVGLWGRSAPPVFVKLAQTGLAVTFSLCAGSSLLYPVAYARSLTRTVEGMSASREGLPLPRRWKKGLHRALARSSAERATFYFTWQTLERSERLQLYLSMIAGIASALLLSSLLAFQRNGQNATLILSSAGARYAAPILSFWAVFGLRSALRSPLAQKGSWIFPVISGAPHPLQMRGAISLVAALSIAATWLGTLLVVVVEPAHSHASMFLLSAAMCGMASSLLLTDLLFLPLRTIPLTEARRASTTNLPLDLITCCIGFPLWVSLVLRGEEWGEHSIAHLLVLAAAVFLLHHGLLFARRKLLTQTPSSDDLLLIDLNYRRD